MKKFRYFSPRIISIPLLVPLRRADRALACPL
jgi:hypothetical protein